MRAIALPSLFDDIPLEKINIEEARDLLFQVDVILRELEDAGAHIFLEAAKPPVDVLKMKYNDDLLSLYKKVENGDLTPSGFQKQARPLITKNFEAAYRAGKGVELDDGDREWIRRASNAEVNHAFRLAKEVETEENVDLESRAAHYSAALDGVGWNGKVEGMPEDSIIAWKLGKGEHCQDCVLLACFLSKKRLIVETKGGRRNFDEVEVGDEVLTHLGRFRRISSKMEIVTSTSRGCAVLVTRDGFVGITDDHPLWTSRGWMMAREVASEGKRCLQGLRQGDRFTGRALQVMRGKEAREACSLRGASEDGLHAGRSEESLCRELLRGGEEENGLAASVGLGDEERTHSGGDGHSSSEWRPVRRSIGEFGAEGEERAQAATHGGREESFLEKGENRDENLSLLREGDRGLRVEPEDVLFACLQEQADHEGSNDEVCLCGVREDSREASLQEKELREKFLLSRLLSEGSVGREDEDDDPAVRFLREALRSGSMEDREVEVGEVLLLEEVLPPETSLFDLEVEEDHSFIACGLAVHNSHSPYTKRTLPTTPRSGDTDCRFNCKCTLTFTRGKKGGTPRSGLRGVPSSLTPGEAEGARARKGLSLDELLAPREPPKGLRLPDMDEREELDELWNEVNYQRRLIAELDPVEDEEEYRRAIMRRKSANQEIIDLMKEKDLWDEPLFSVDEVLTGAELPPAAEEDIFAKGIVGSSLEGDAGRKVRELLDRYEREMDEKLLGEL